MRAYSSELEACGIQKTEFVTFIDGLNESFVGHPIYQGLGIVGGVMSMFYGVSPVQWAGTGLQVASGVASAGTSYFRTKAYVKAMNKDLFNPAGLHINIMTTAKMMQKVGYPESRLQLPPLDLSGDLETANSLDLRPKDAARVVAANQSPDDDPRMRRLKALEGYVAPLDLNVPAHETPDNLLRKMGAAQAARLSRKQNKKLMKGNSRYIKKSMKADRKQRKVDAKVEKMERKFAEKSGGFQGYASGSADPREQDKTSREYEKMQRKIDRKMAKADGKINKKAERADDSRRKTSRKEEKTAHKIRWIVISNWERRGEGSDEDSMPGSEPEDEKERVYGDEKESVP